MPKDCIITTSDHSTVRGLEFLHILILLVLYVEDMTCECHWFPQHYKKRWFLTGFESSIIGTHDASFAGRYIDPELRKVDIRVNEQDRSRPVGFLRKADIWAIGCVIYQLATTGRKSVPYDFEGSELAELPPVGPKENPSGRKGAIRSQSWNGSIQ
jgi:hypothetical protein